MFMKFAMQLKDRVGFYPTIKEYKSMVSVIMKKTDYDKTPEVIYYLCSMI